MAVQFPDKPSGLTPVKYLGGADWTGQANMYYIDSTDGNAFYPGDLVACRAGLDTVRGIQTITLAAAGGVAVGVLIAVGTNPDGGPYIDPTNLTLTSAPATKTKSYYALVVDDPNVIFEVQEGSTSYGTGTAFTNTATSKNVNIVAHAPAAGVAYSGTVIDRGTVPATTNTYNLRLLGLVRRYEAGVLMTYATGGANTSFPKWNCLINNHQYRTGLTGI